MTLREGGPFLNCQLPSNDDSSGARVSNCRQTTTVDSSREYPLPTTLAEVMFGKRVMAREYLRLVGRSWFGIPDIEPWLKTCLACGDEFIVVPGGFRSKYAKRCFPCRLADRPARNGSSAPRPTTIFRPVVSVSL